MSLTIGTGPFGRHGDKHFNFRREGPEHVLFFEETPRRVRATFAGETVVDSRRAKVLHETGLLPRYYFPREDVRMDLLRSTDRSTHCPFKGDASYWSVHVGDRVAENAVWGYPEPIEGAPPLADHVSVYWEALDHWYEEDEEVFGHLRDPYHRIDVLPSSRHVRVSLGGVVLAESRRPVLLHEAGLPARWYLPREDVRMELLEADDGRQTRCAYKGLASYWSARIGDRVEEAIAWHYPATTREVEPIVDLICFFNERVDVEVDGEPEARPETQWSTPVPAAKPA
jgi:uncharacterized protein (DUF427 family)